MSELRTNLLSDLAGTGPATLHKQSAAKAWANYKGTSTTSIRGSFGVSSAVDNGAGDYSFNFSNAMSNANYKISISASNSQQFIRDTAFSGADPTTTTFRVGTRTTSAVFTDTPYVCVSAHGDLA